MKIGPDICLVIFFVFYKYDEDTSNSKHWLNLSDYYKDGSLGSPYALPGHSWRRKRHDGDKGGVDEIYLAFDHTCWNDFVFAHIVTTPPTHPPFKKLRVAEAAHQLRN